jgi:FAD:protein FMN transferase
MIRLAVEAMATRFELLFDGPRAAGEEALDEIVRLEKRLNRYDPSSDVSWINRHAASRAIKVEPALFRLLQRAVAFSELTDGAFDITVGPLMRAWKFEGDAGALPSPTLVAAARLDVGYRQLLLDVKSSTIRSTGSGVGIDLGAIGKGYAIDAAVAILRDHGVTRALLHGGTSSVHALGAGPDGKPWRIAWRPRGGVEEIFELSDSALSVSAIHGKSFRAGAREYGHVMDPRTGEPTAAATSAIVTGPESTACDALSTAMLVLGPGWIEEARSRFPEYQLSCCRQGCENPPRITSGIPVAAWSLETSRVIAKPSQISEQ